MKVSVVIPCLTEQLWHVYMTVACAKIARTTTEMPYELVISEAVGQHFRPEYTNEFGMRIDRYHHNPRKGFANADQNAGMDLATGDIVVLLTNDVFVKPGWLEALLDCFKFQDCGMASLGTSDHRETPTDFITEGIWCPLMAFRREPRIRFDAETFPSYWGDYDLVMQVYDHGLRAYRNRRVVVDHLGRATNTSAHPLGSPKEIEEARNRFMQRWGTSHQLIFRILVEGHII